MSYEEDSDPSFLTGRTHTYTPFYNQDYVNADTEYYSDEVDPEIEEKLYSMIHHQYKDEVSPPKNLEQGVQVNISDQIKKALISYNGQQSHCEPTTSTPVTYDVRRNGLLQKTENTIQSVNKRRRLEDPTRSHSTGTVQKSLLDTFLKERRMGSTSQKTLPDARVVVTIDSSNDSDSDCVILSDCERKKYQDTSSARDVNNVERKQADSNRASCSKSTNLNNNCSVSSILTGKTPSESESSSSASSEDICLNSTSWKSAAQPKLSNVHGSKRGLSRLALTEATKSYYEDDCDGDFSERGQSTELSLELLDTLPLDRSRKFKRIKLNPGEDPDLWKLDVKDLMPYGKNARYYQNSKHCKHCRKYGNHPSNLCSTPSRPPACYLCGEQGHYGDSCTNGRCRRCSAAGHHAAQCSSKPTKCKLCKIKGHEEPFCTFHWRKYSNVTSMKNQSKIKKNAFDFEKNERKFCSNCAGNHLAIECDRVGDSRFSSPIFGMPTTHCSVHKARFDGRTSNKRPYSPRNSTPRPRIEDGFSKKLYKELLKEERLEKLRNKRRQRKKERKKQKLAKAKEANKEMVDVRKKRKRKASKTSADVAN